jgi:hypothetical protein
MELAARQSSSQRLDRVRLTDNVTKQRTRVRTLVHGRVIGATPRRGKRAGAIALFCGLFGACASEPPPRVDAPPPPPPVVSSANTALPLSPIELSQRALAEASTTSDARERCRLLQDATILDPSSLDARVARAESRCAFASELLADARVAFAKRKDRKTAEVLAVVAERASSRADQKLAAELLATLDVSSKLIAARIFAIDEPERAAVLFDEVALARESKGATLDALDARLDAAMARADAGKPSTLAPLVDTAAAAAKSYGAEWIAPKVVETIAAARLAGEDVTAIAERSEKLGLFATAAARDAFAIERAIATGKDLARVHERVRDPAVRVLLAANAKDCASASAHARAHHRLPHDGLVLARDLARVMKRVCPNGEVAGRTTIVPPSLSPELADLLEVARVDSLHARARLEQFLKEHPGDPGAHRAAIEIDLYSASGVKRAIDAAVAATDEPTFRGARVGTFSGHERALAAREFVSTTLQATIEARTPRALAQGIAAMLRAAYDDTDAAWNDVASALVTACAASSIGACVPGPPVLEGAPSLVAGSDPGPTDLARATSRIRRSNPKLLADKGPLLSPEDLTSPLVRLDVIVGLVDQKKIAPALKLRSGSWVGPEASLADAVITAGNGNCALAKSALIKSMTLKDTHSDVFARIAKNCP